MTAYFLVATDSLFAPSVKVRSLGAGDKAADPDV